MEDLEVDVERCPDWWIQPTTIYAAFTNVMREVGYLQKKKVQGVAWKAILEEDVLEAFRPTLIRNSLIFRVDDAELIHTETFESGEGEKAKKAFRSIIKVKFCFVFCTPSGVVQQIPGCVLSEAHSFAGMSVAAAMTMAVKYALRETFLLRTGSDPDSVAPPSYPRGKSVQADSEAEKFSQASKLIETSPSIHTLDKRESFIRSKGVPIGFERQFDVVCEKKRGQLKSQTVSQVSVDDSDSETLL